MAVTTALLVAQWNLAAFQPILYLWCLFMAVSVAIIAHNHNHVPIWRTASLNLATDYWLTLFYGFPAFGWIPTHNKNHHFLNNKAGDYTITYRVSEEQYPDAPQLPVHQQLFSTSPDRRLPENPVALRPEEIYLAASQYAVLGLYYTAAVVLNWKKAVLFILIPHQVSLFSVLIFNYVQHVHTDEESSYNHARNFVGLINLALFNNGYHTIHHKSPGIHWSETPAAQREIQMLIDPSLNERSFWWYMVRVYLLAPFHSGFGTVSKRLERINSQAARAD